MIKTTRIKTVQAPRVNVYDLSDQTNGVTQTFTLPVSVGGQCTHYLLFNTTVYKNDENHVFYELSTDGRTLTTFFDSAPLHGDKYALQFVVNGGDEGGSAIYVTREEMDAAIREAINDVAHIFEEDDNTNLTEGD